MNYFESDLNITSLVFVPCRGRNNCLKSSQNSHPNPEMAKLMNVWYGQLYTADEQCQMNFGADSYLCRVRFLYKIKKKSRPIFHQSGILRYKRSALNICFLSWLAITAVLYKMISIKTPFVT